MIKTTILFSMLVLPLSGCKGQPEMATTQENPISAQDSSSDERQFGKENFNEIESDTAKWVTFESEYHFETFKTTVFKGKLANIDFTGAPFATDQDYVESIAANDTGINFGGHYTIIRKSCGCMCEYLFVIDRISGKIYTDINLTTPDDGDGKWGYVYQPDSNLLIANSCLFTSGSFNCYTAVWGTTPELYLWTGESFKRIQ